MVQSRLHFRRARREDLNSIITLIAEDGLGRGREVLNQEPASEYVSAFNEMARDPNQLMAVIESDDQVIGYMQITFIPGLSRKGAWRGQLESVRVASHLRGRGIGEKFFLWAIEQCRGRGCSLVQLTTDKQRKEALRFYSKLGFEESHRGMKMQI